MSVSRALPWRRVHITGIGGVGTSGLAHILADFGVQVTGSDAAESAMTELLAGRGIEVRIGHAPELVDGIDLLIYSGAVPPTDPERVRAAAAGIAQIRRGEFLARLTGHFDQVVAVAGSHGKTTTTAMLVHILRSAGRSPGFLIGGTVPGWVRSAARGDGAVLITEVDESDGTQALVHSTCGIVVNVDDDHCWSVGGVDALHRNFRDFAERAKLLLCAGDAVTRDLLGGHPNARFLTAAYVGEATCVSVPGEHNRSNAALALAAAVELGVAPAAARRALASFPGVDRRLTCHLVSRGGRCVVVEDYAHHPTELRAALKALRETHPDHRLIAVFQPHRFERIKRYAAAFADCLAAADQVELVRPFAAWLDDDDVADPATIAAAVTGVPCRCHQQTGAAVAEVLLAGDDAFSRTLYAVIGAGDVNRVVRPLCAGIVRADTQALAMTLRGAFPDMAIRTDCPWARLTTLRVGRACPVLVEPLDEDALRGILRWAWSRGVPVRTLGAGSNLVGTDEVQCEVVVAVRPGCFAEVAGEPGVMWFGAGATLTHAVRRLIDAGAGVEAAPLAWIPGSLGGAVRMNAGADGATIGACVAALRGVRLHGESWSAAGTEVEWGYRHGGIPEDVIVTAVGFHVRPGAAAASRAVLEHSGRRRRRQPAGATAGCVFRNPEGTSAGLLLDRCGCKGMREGGAVVSSEHANYLVAEPGAVEADVAALICRLQRTVFAASGHILAPEVCFAGARTAERVQRQVRVLTYEKARLDRARSPGGA